MWKRAVVLLCLLCGLPFLTGCWDRRELNDIATVTAAAFDKDPGTGGVLLTVEVVRPNSLRKQGSVTEAPYAYVVSEGDTVMEAVRNTNKHMDRICFFSQLRAIVVDETFARENMRELIDFVSRTHEIRKYTWLLVAKDTRAGTVLQIKHGINTIQASYMEGLMNSKENNSDVTATNVLDFLKTMLGEGNCPVVGVCRINVTPAATALDNDPAQRQELVISQSAVFHGAKLTGYLNGDETRGLNFITGSVKSGAIHVPGLQDPGKKISVEIMKASSRITPKAEGKTLRFDISVKVQGNITEVGDETDVSLQDNLDRINAEFSKSLERNIREAVGRAQALKADILGFGRAYELGYPRRWQAEKADWAKGFPAAAYTVRVEAQVKQTGLLQKPLEAD